MKRLVLLVVLMALSTQAYPESTETRWWIFYQGFHMVHYPRARFDTAMADDTVPMKQRFGPFTAGSGSGRPWTDCIRWARGRIAPADEPVGARAGWGRPGGVDHRRGGDRQRSTNGSRMAAGGSDGLPLVP